MNLLLAKEIIGCLQVSGSPLVPGERLRAYHPHDWKRIIAWLDDSGLALPFWNRLRGTQEEDAVLSDLRVQLTRNFEDHRARIAAMCAEFESINRCFERAGLKYAVLKGFALVPEYCPVASLRTAYDYDYLLPAGSEGQAERELKAMGYIRKEEFVDHPRVYFHWSRHPRRPQTRDDLYSANFVRTVELHFRLWEPDLLKISFDLPENPLACVRRRYILPSQLDLLSPSETGRGLEFYALSEEDELIFQVLHAFRHILQNWCRLCSLLDIAYFLEHRLADAGFWKQFMRRIAASEPLREITGIIFMLSARVFGATIPASVAAEMVRNLRTPLALWVQRYGHELALNNFSDNKFSLFLHREFIQNDGAWRELRRKSLFPLHRPNSAEESPGSTPFYHLRTHWRRGYYIVKRLRHHAVATVRYGLESRRWQRIRSGDI